MIRNDICCDICGKVVAEIKPGFFNKISVVRKFLVCKTHKYFGSPEHNKAHICFDCIYEIQNAIQNKEQSK